MHNYTVKKSTNEGSGHWIGLRVAAIANVFFVTWFVISMLMIANGNIENARIWLSKPFNAIILILMLGNVFYHGTLGIREVIEDYVHNKAAKYTLIIGTVFAGFFAVVTGIFAVFQIYASVNFAG